MITLFVSLGYVWNVIKDISSMPLIVKLLLDELNYSFLFGLDACLLLSKAVEFGLPISDFFSICVKVLDPAKGIFIPNIQKGNENVSSEVIECLLTVAHDISLIIFIFNAIKRMARMFEYVELVQLSFIFY